jgi:FKBP-type peptidyl-prolyl cis-trans isomerase SlyD
MKIQKNKVVAVSYELEVEGKTADKAGSEAPLEYIHGTGMLLPKFEAALDGKVAGDPFEFTLSPEEGYGTYNPNYLVQLPMEAFIIDGRTATELLVPGRTLPMLNSEGQVVQGTIAAVGEKTVTMDFNHPMAGKILHFTGKVEAVREATEKELTEGLHGEYLPKEGCGNCHKGGCKDGDCGCEGDCGSEDCGCEGDCGCKN